MQNKNRFVLYALLLANLWVYGQKRIETFNQVSREEIKMSTYEKDTLAEAVILFDIGKTRFVQKDNGGYEILFTRHKRIKIFKKEAAEEFAKISIPFYNDGYGKTEIVNNIKATTFTLNLQNQLVKTELDKSEVYEEQNSERWFQKKFVFPNVQNGSVLDVYYELETPFHFNLPDWNFQDKVPTLYSEYELRMIPFYEYVFFVQGINSFDYQHSEPAPLERSYFGLKFKDYVHVYALKDIPAFKDESYITSINDYIVKMDFQLAKFHSPEGDTHEIISTWAKLNKSLLDNKYFGKYIKKASKYAKKILETELTLSGLNQDQKAEKIINYVKTNYAWNGYNSKYTTKSAKEVYTSKEGNSAEINLLLIALLQQAGIDSSPVILSTRDHGKIAASYPFDHFTNYVTAFVNTTNPFLADATEDILPYNMLPVKCFNGQGLIVKEESERWVNLNSNISSYTTQNITLDFDPENETISANVFIKSSKYDAFEKRKTLKDNPQKIKEYYSNHLPNITSVKTVNYDSYNKPYSLMLKGDYTPEKVGENYMVYPLLNFPLTKNPLIHKDRNYPVDFKFISDNKFVCFLTIPDGYTISSIPKAYKVKNSLVDVAIQYKFSNQQLSITGNYKHKKSVYNANEYHQIKNHLSSIVKYFNQPVLIKKTPE